MAWEFLSHSIDAETPGFGGSKSLKIEIRKSIASGGSSNSFDFKMPNHFGTHIDLPKHFDDNGKSLSDFDATDFVFSSVGLVTCTPEHDQLLGSEILSRDLQSDIDLLLIKTRWSEKRAQNEYWERNPGISATMADALRSRFTKLRAIGFDFISLTAFQKRSEGREAHQCFLRHERPILIIEDMNLKNIHSAPQRVIVSPLLLRDADGAPVTVLAEL